MTIGMLKIEIRFIVFNSFLRQVLAIPGFVLEPDGHSHKLGGAERRRRIRFGYAEVFSVPLRKLSC